MPTPPPPSDTSHDYHRRHGLAAGRQATRAAMMTLAFSLSLSGLYAQPSPPPPASVDAPSPFSYADVADLVSRSSLVAVARPRSFAKVPPNGAATPPGTQRFYVDAQVDSLIRGDAGLSPRIAFLLDVPLDVRPSRAMKGKSFVLFGRAGPRPGEFQLLSSTAILPSSAATDARVRAITAELVARDAPPEIVRVVEAFHVEGTVAGESETQIFLATRGGRPVSLSVIRRPSEAPRFGAALGEIVDEAADVPPHDTLLWYRLACGLPPALPTGAAMKLDAPAAQAAAADYRAFLDRLGACARTRPAFGGTPAL